MTISVSNRPIKTQQPYVKSEVNNSCIHTKVITVPVPVGGERHVIVSNTGTGTNSMLYDKDETITTTTDYTLEIDGSISSNESQNTEFASCQMFVSLEDGTTPFYATQITRQHTGNIC